MNKEKASLPPYPKKPLNGYFRFAKEQRVKNKNPKEIKSAYDQLSEAQKAKLTDAWRLEMVDFNKEVENWEEKYGQKPPKSAKKEQGEVSKAEKEKGAMNGKANSKKVEEKPKDKSTGKPKDKKGGSKEKSKPKK